MIYDGIHTKLNLFFISKIFFWDFYNNFDDYYLFFWNIFIEYEKSDGNRKGK